MASIPPRTFVEKHWYRLSPLSVLLYPLSLLYGAAMRLRLLLYRLRILPSAALGVPVIVVGNVLVGGTGKTPLVLWLAEQLRRRGANPAILSRGYGGDSRAPRQVKPGDDPFEVGDEPLLLAERSGCPVWIGANRLAAGRALLAAHPRCDVILCDDGLQHYRLRRDLEIAVEDERGFGNGLLLPAGPLREPADRRVDLRVANSPAPVNGAWSMRLRATQFYRLSDPSAALQPASLAGRRLHAVAGIGNPRRFFDLLEALGLHAVPHVFPDHHRYAPGDLEFADGDFVLMTEKDAVKCRRFGRGDLIAVRVDAELDHAFADLVWSRIHGRPPA